MAFPIIDWHFSFFQVITILAHNIWYLWIYFHMLKKETKP